MKSAKQGVLLGMLAGLLIISKEIISFLPNIELVSFLLIVYTLVLGLGQAFIISIVFCFVQMMLYGIGLWTPCYFVVWPLLCLLTHLLKNKLDTEFKLALFSGAFGLCFGLLFTIPYLFIDLHLAYSTYISGIFFDLVHCVGNYLIMLVLYTPFIRIFKPLYHSYIK